MVLIWRLAPIPAKCDSTCCGDKSVYIVSPIIINVTFSFMELNQDLRGVDIEFGLHYRNVDSFTYQNIWAPHLNVHFHTMNYRKITILVFTSRS